jgi:hypothetical protein
MTLGDLEDWVVKEKGKRLASLPPPDSLSLLYEIRQRHRNNLIPRLMFESEFPEVTATLACSVAPERFEEALDRVLGAAQRAAWDLLSASQRRQIAEASVSAEIASHVKKHLGTRVRHESSHWHHLAEELV